MASEDDIKLRPVEERDLDTLGRFDTDPALSEPFEWRGYKDPKARRQRWEQDGYLGNEDSLLVVSLADGTFAGFVAWR
ncbi:MAG: GNAT family N-acetyltransferase, partial [Haloechinothrix sp.]